MQKKRLKSLITKMYDALIENIETQDAPTKEHLIIYLQNVINTLSNAKVEDNDELMYTQISFTNLYKEIADESILQYQNTNEKLDEISKLQEEALDEFNAVYIDLPKMTEKFTDVQDHMRDEISRANDIISNLLSQVKTLETTSNIDSLTNIFNRRALNTYLDNICTKKTFNHQLHLLILDIDDFKLINDTHGHIAGDKILIFIANILKRTLRDGDKVFRYGGEEFIVVLNRISNDLCMNITQRILEIISSNQLIYDGASLKVTVSIGATIYAPGDTPDTLIARADKALYKSKQNGKNQINTEIL